MRGLTRRVATLQRQLRVSLKQTTTFLFREINSRTSPESGAARGQIG